MKKLLFLIVAIVVLGLIVAGCGIPVVPPVEQNEPSSLTKAGITLTVGPSGCDFTTIQAAITAANPFDTIQVAAGTYNEGALVFDKDDITLIGSGTEATTIVTSSTTYGVSVLSDVDYITIKGFTIEENKSMMEIRLHQDSI